VCTHKQQVKKLQAEKKKIASRRGAAAVEANRKTRRYLSFQPTVATRWMPSYLKMTAI